MEFVLNHLFAVHTFLHYFCKLDSNLNPLNAELNPICHLLALLGGATIVDVSRLRVNVSHHVVYNKLRIQEFSVEMQIYYPIKADVQPSKTQLYTNNKLISYMFRPYWGHLQADI
jgi:hypothetical protein